MDIDKEHIVIFVEQLDSLVPAPTLVDLYQPRKAPNTMIVVDNIVAHPQLIELGNGHLLVTLDLTLDLVALVTLKDLVVCVETNFSQWVNKTLM